MTDPIIDEVRLGPTPARPRRRKKYQPPQEKGLSHDDVLWLAEVRAIQNRAGLYRAWGTVGWLFAVLLLPSAIIVLLALGVLITSLITGDRGMLSRFFDLAQ